MRTGSLLEERLRRARELYMEGDILGEKCRKREIEKRLEAW